MVAALGAIRVKRSDKAIRRILAIRIVAFLSLCAIFAIGKLGYTTIAHASAIL
jgi:hypothetical protein